MNNITLREYQRKMTDKITEKANVFLSNFDESDFKKIIFQSPTGSGKTVMMANILERLSIDYDENLSFVWISKGILAEQSKNSFEKMIGGGGIKMSFLEDVLDNKLKENEILFVNWEKIFSKANKDNPDKDVKKGDPLNKFMKDNEWDKTLMNFCSNARDNGRKIVLVIDESHLNITPNTIKIIEDIIKPALQIDVTATPKNISYDYGDREGEFIELQVVKDAEVIKKEVVINTDITREDLKTEKGGDRVIFEKAIEKRNELVELYKKEKSKVHPLVLIQLPNESEKISVLDKQKKEWVEEFLDNIGINYENGKLAKWFSGKEKENKDNITDIDSEVQFLIFKQAIAVGWDCPRASILIKFRETKSETFEIQTVGRIMRMPEFKHYDTEALNRAYVYANLLEIKIDENALEYIKTQKAVRKEIYEDLNLNSVYITRAEYNDLTFDYRNFFFKEFIKEIKGDLDIKKSRQNFNKLKNHKDITVEVKKIEEDIIINEILSDIDKEQTIKAKGDLKVMISEEDVEKYFILLLKQNCSPFQQARSFGVIKTALYQTLDKYLDFSDNLSQSKLDWQKFVLINKDFFIRVIVNSITKYAEDRKKKQGQVESKIWNVSEYDYYSKNAINPKNGDKELYKKCVMKPCYVVDKWKTEIKFIENYLEKDREIEWWYKNGDAKNEIYFAIKYEENNKPRAFYPDFIVKYKNGRVGIFDTKEGATAKSGETILKSNALQDYVSKTSKKLFGGIVIPNDKEMKIWKINQDKKYNYEEGNWEVLPRLKN